jgi:hypothetical protein
MYVQKGERNGLGCVGGGSLLLLCRRSRWKEVCGNLVNFIAFFTKRGGGGDLDGD